MAQTLKAELSALRLMIQQARDNISDIEIPEGRGTRCLELLNAAYTLADDLVKSGAGIVAAQLGAKGGKTTAKRMKLKDPEYYKRIAAMRKTKAGGRPRKQPPA